MSANKRAIHLPQAPPSGSYTPLVEAGGLLFVSGQSPDAAAIARGEVGEQTEQVLRKVESLLRAGGAGLADVVKVGVFLASISDFAAFDSAYRRLMPEPLPARTTVAATLAEGLVEIDAIAVKPPPGELKDGPRESR